MNRFLFCTGRTYTSHTVNTVETFYASVRVIEQQRGREYRCDHSWYCRRLPSNTIGAILTIPWHGTSRQPSIWSLPACSTVVEDDTSSWYIKTGFLRYPGECRIDHFFSTTHVSTNTTRQGPTCCRVLSFNSHN